MKPAAKSGKAAFFLMLLLALGATALFFDALPAHFAPLGTPAASLALTVLEDTLRVSLAAAFISAVRALPYAEAFPLAGRFHLTRLLPLWLAFSLPEAPLAVPAAAVLIGFAVRPGRTLTKHSNTP